MKQSIFKILENEKIAADVFKMTLSGDISEITAPGIRMEDSTTAPWATRTLANSTLLLTLPSTTQPSVIMQLSTWACGAI